MARTRASRRRRRPGPDQGGTAVDIAGLGRDFLSQARPLLAAGRHAELAQLAGQALARDRSLVAAWEMLGAASHASGQFPHAAGCFSAATQLEPTQSRHFVNLAAALVAQGELPAAIEAGESALKCAPDSARAHTVLATIHVKQGRTDEAEAGFLRALAIDESHVDARFNLGQLWTKQGRVEDAIAACRRAIEFAPDDARVWASLVSALLAWDESSPRELEVACRRALELDPENPRNLNNLAVVWITNSRRDEAKKLLLKALHLDPDCAAALNNLSEMLTQEGAVEEALALAQQAIRLDDQRSSYWGTLGNAQAAAEDYQAAARSFRHGIELGGPIAPLELSLGMVRLREGDWIRGWRGYHARLRTREFAHLKTNVPLWQPERDRGKIVLLRCEQGAGDSLQFIRFVREVRAAGAGEIWLECPKRLMPTLAVCPEIDVLYQTDEVPAGYDVQCPLMSLPMQLGLTLDSLAGFSPYLRAQPQRIAQWRRRLDEGFPGTFRVGINWCGAKKPMQDPREIPLDCFAKLAEIDNIQLISLQRGRGAEHLQAGESPEWLAEFSDLDRGQPYADTAALAHALDLVISSDTSVPHLVGALNQPLWLLLPKPCEWRWMDERTDSPWYPSMRIFRQQVTKDWSELFERVALELGKVCGTRPG